MSGTIVTFYSYKGGVGRTAALANIGVVLSRWGYRVLLVDWDLEAPGLQAYVAQYAETPTVDGVANFLLAKNGGTRPRPARLQIEGTDELFYVAAAGSPEPTASPAVISVDLAALYESASLGQRLEDLRAKWKEEYDFVLLDSRTGITDIGGICTAQLPDLLCLCFTTNAQSLEGALDLANRADRARAQMPVDRARLLVLPLLTRFESAAERDLTDQWEMRVADQVAPLIADWAPDSVTSATLLPHLRVPYVPRWSFGEELPVLREDSSDSLSVTYAIETISALIANQLTDTGLLVENRALYVRRADRRAKSVDVAEDGFASDLVIVAESAQQEYARRFSSALGELGVAARVTTTAGQAEDLAFTRHCAILIGPEVTSGLESFGRRLLLELASSDVDRIVIPVIIDGGDRARLPTSLRNLQSLSVVGVPIREAARVLAAHMGLGANLAERRPQMSVPVDPWAMTSIERFNRLLAEEPASEAYRYGFWTVTYGLAPTRIVDFGELKDGMIASRWDRTGWPLWMWPSSDSIRPSIVSNAIECWFGRDQRAWNDPSEADYWRAGRDLKLFLLRGYQEDAMGGEGSPQPPGVGFDTVLPTWRIAEALIHALRLANHFGLEDAAVTLRAEWQGLRGRRLVSWANSRRHLWGDEYVSEEERYAGQITVALRDVPESLAEPLYELLKPLYLLFNFFELPYTLVEEEVGRLLSGR